MHFQHMWNPFRTKDNFYKTDETKTEFWGQSGSSSMWLWKSNKLGKDLSSSVTHLPAKLSETFKSLAAILTKESTVINSLAVVQWV